MMMKRLIVLTLFVAGCNQAQPASTHISPVATPTPAAVATPSAVAATPTPAATPRPFLVTKYDAGDFEIGVPEGWQQVHKDLPASLGTTRIQYSTNGSDAAAEAEMSVRSMPQGPSTRDVAFAELRRLALIDPDNQDLADVANSAGERWGISYTNVARGIPRKVIQCIVIRNGIIYIIGGAYQRGQLDDERILQIAGSFRAK